MNKIYLDNAATTALDEEVLDAMLPYLRGNYGNPSSLHAYGREARIAVETARKKVAELLHCDPREIIFTSGGTESNNTAIAGAVRQLDCRYIISSPLEHKAVLDSVEYYAEQAGLSYRLLDLYPDGHLWLDHLEEELSAQEGPCLVTLMHANNEIGNLLDLEAVSQICQDFNAVLHTDCVQTIGHYEMDFSRLNVSFASASAHKFHGPKGVGMLYVNRKYALEPFIRGGGQELGRRGGTENVGGIVGFASALSLSLERAARDQQYIGGLKKYMTEMLTRNFPGIRFNGDTGDSSLYTVLNVSFPPGDATELLLLLLDQQGICISGGSACSAGAGKPSHVISALHGEDSWPAFRFSFCRHNSIKEIDTVISELSRLLM